MHHVDLYRLNEVAELAELGLDRALGRDGVWAVEWIDRFPDIVPASRVEVSLSIVSARKRRLELVGVGPRGTEIIKALRSALEVSKD